MFQVEDNHAKSDATAKPAESSEQPAAPVGKYVPPAQRKNQTVRERISRSLKGLLNRLSEANMSSISKQVIAIHQLDHQTSKDIMIVFHAAFVCRWKNCI